jgi:sugar phosphate isomerase/epimerase
MIPAIDSFCYHRFFGQPYPGREADPGVRLSTPNFLKKAKAMGAAGVSLETCFFDDFSDLAMDELRQALDDLAMQRVWAWGHPKGLKSGTDQAALEDLISHIRIARRLGASVMRICAGGRGTRPDSWTQHKANLLPMLQKAADAAARDGVVLAIENHLDLYADELVDLLDTLASSQIGACFDTANNLRMFEDPIVVARKLSPYARATHIKDVVAVRGDPRTLWFWPSVPAGKGLIDLDAILALLQSEGYAGLLALEIDYLHPDHGEEDSAVQSGMEFLKGWIDKTGKRPAAEHVRR